MKVKDAGTAAAKFASRAAAAGQAYTDGVNNPKRPWAASTEAAAGTYSTAVQQAVSDGRFTKGVAKAGDAKWQNGAKGKGAQRYPQGVQAGQGNYQSGVAPYLQTLSSLNLPARGPKGDPGNVNRVTVIANALRAQKLAK